MRMTTLLNFRICFATVVICLGISGPNAYAADAQDHIDAAQKYLDDRELSTAIIELKNALQKDPGSQEARFLLGNTYLAMRDGALAEKELSRYPESRLGTRRVDNSIGPFLFTAGEVSRSP